MLQLVFIAFFLLGSVVGWLVVYFVRKYKDYAPRVLRDTALLFFGGACLDLFLALMDKELCLVSLMAYVIGATVAFFVHWIYQLIIVKVTAPKFLDPRSKYALFSGCSLPEETRNKMAQNVYMLECINKGYQLLNKELIDEKEFGKLVKESGLTLKMLEEITDGSWGDMFLSPDLTAYIKAKGLLDKRE